VTHPAVPALSLLVCALTLSAQTPAPKQPNGLEADWEIAPVLQEMSAHAMRLVPVLEKIDPAPWVSRGASDTYAEQLQSCKEQARAIAVTAKALAANPEKLGASLELLFRIQALETMLISIEEGMRRYEMPAQAQQLISLEAENGANRDRFQRYIVNLAVEREQDLQVMDREAQRCRGILTQAPPRTARKK